MFSKKSKFFKARESQAAPRVAKQLEGSVAVFGVITSIHHPKNAAGPKSIGFVATKAAVVPYIFKNSKNSGISSEFTAPDLVIEPGCETQMAMMFGDVSSLSPGQFVVLSGCYLDAYKGDGMVSPMIRLACSSIQRQHVPNYQAVLDIVRSIPYANRTFTSLVNVTLTLNCFSMANSKLCMKVNVSMVC